MLKQVTTNLQFCHRSQRCVKIRIPVVKLTLHLSGYEQLRQNLIILAHI